MPLQERSVIISSITSKNEKVSHGLQQSTKIKG